MLHSVGQLTLRAGLPVERPSFECAGAPLQAATEPREELNTKPCPRVSYLWATLLARVYQARPGLSVTFFTDAAAPFC